MATGFNEAPAPVSNMYKFAMKSVNNKENVRRNITVENEHNCSQLFQGKPLHFNKTIIQTANCKIFTIVHLQYTTN